MNKKIPLKKYISFFLFFIIIGESVLFFTTSALASDKIPNQNQQNPISNDWWPMFRHDSTHSGFTTATTPEDNSVLWTYQTNFYITSSPSISHGRVYIGSDDWNLYCFDMDNGSLLWNYTTSGKISSSPAVINGKVYVGSDDTKLYCLNSINGSLLWKYHTNSLVQSSPTVVDEKVFFGTHDGSLFCLDSEDGYLLWRYQTNSVILASPALSDRKVYCGTTSGKIFCLNDTTGSPIWVRTMSEGTYSSPVIHSGKMFFGSNDYNVYCLDANDGTILWNYTTLGEVHTSPALAYDYVYIGTYNGQVICLHKDTGVFQWSYQINGAVESSPAISDGKLYFGTDPCCGFSSYFICLNAHTGTILWQYNFNTQLHMKSSPAIAAGKVFVGSADGKVYAFGDIEYLADANGPYYQIVNYSINFTGSVYGGEPDFTWYWDFGDMSTSTERNPSHVYTISGTYNVTLVVTDSHGTIATDETIASIKPPNTSPDIPLIDGPVSGKPETSYSFTVVSSDPENDFIFYYIDWGDNTTSEWTGPFFSGDQITLNHSWSDIGTYFLKAKTKDRHGAISNWSTPLEITIMAPNLEIDVRGGLGLTVTIRNMGNGPATNISWNITFTGSFVFPAFRTGLISIIPANDVVRIRVFVVGFSKFTITLSAICDEEISIQKTSEASLFGFFVFRVQQ